MRRIQISALALVAVVMAVAGCGSSKSAGTSSSASTATAAASSTPAVVTTPAKLATGAPLTRAALIVKGDATCASTKRKVSAISARSTSQFVRVLPQIAI